MARIRSIKPEFWKNEELADLDPLVRLLFIGLWNFADRRGRLEDRPKKLKAEIFPYEENIDMSKMLDVLQASKFILRYEHDSKHFIQILTFEKHQVINVRENESTIPAPVQHSTETVPELQEGKGREGNREGKEQETREENFCVDDELQKSILEFFGFTEISDQRKVIETGNFINLLHSTSQLSHFKKNWQAYRVLKRKDQKPHRFQNFIGSAHLNHSDGAWCAENWTKILTEYEQRNQPATTNHGRSQTGARNLDIK